MREQKEKSRGIGWGAIKALAYIAALTFAAGLSQGALAESKRYILQLSSPQLHAQMSSQVRAEQERWTHAHGVVAQSAPSVNLQLLSADVQVEQVLDAVGMMIVEFSDSSAVELLREHPAVAFLEEEVIYPAPQPIHLSARGVYKGFSQAHQYSSYSPMPLPWGVEAVNAPRAWGLSALGQSSRVLVLDTGIDKEHPNLMSRFEGGKNFTTAGDAAPYPYFDDHGHGTHVAGTILADGSNHGLLGVAPQAVLLAGRVCTNQGCPSGAIVAGVNWGIEQGVDVINMSLGGAWLGRAERAVYEKAEEANVMIVAAAGNNGRGQVSFPAALDTVMAVGALDHNLKKADFSQWGKELEIMAPGVDVYSSMPRGTGREAWVIVDASGTVMEPEVLPMLGSPVVKEPVVGDMVFVGLGREEDYKDVRVSGRIALISRGEITFAEKVSRAAENGAIAVIIFNNEEGKFNGVIEPSPGAEAAIPAVSMDQETGESLKESLHHESLLVQVSLEPTDYAEMSGTSMASPHVAGVAALVRSVNPQLSPAEVRAVLRASAMPLVEQDPENKYGSGLVDAYEAVSLALQPSLIP